MSDTLPKGWTIAKLGDICFTTSGGTPSRKVPNYYGGNIPWVKSGELDKGLILDTEEKITEEAIQNSSAKIFPGGTLLIALYGATVGKLAFLGVPAATNQAVCGIYESEAIYSHLLYYFLLYQRGNLIKQSIGGAQPNISQGIIKGLSVPLAPFNEQKRILAKLEQLLTDLDKGIEYLEKAQKQIRIYRRAVLKWTFEGKNQKNKEYIVKDIAKVQIGPFGTQLHKEDYVVDGIPLINPMHIQEGKILANRAYTITKKKRDSLPNYILKEGDVIMGRRGEMARCGLVTEKEDGWFCGTGSLYLRPNKTLIDSKYLLCFLTGDTAKSYLEEKAGGTTMANLNLKIVNNMPICLPSIDEQIKVVHEIESRLSICEKIGETIENSLLQAEALRLSIIKKAFEGKLVPQDPNDEPAEKLLERIRAAKGKAKPEKKEKVKMEKKPTQKRKEKIEI
jgi:type I restriction enzyme S subunit